jgi:hypothetical protein
VGLTKLAESFHSHVSGNEFGRERRQSLVEALDPLPANSLRQFGVLGQVLLQPRPRRRTRLARKVDGQQVHYHFLWNAHFGSSRRIFPEPATVKASRER